MAVNHTEFTDIHPMFKAKLVCNFSLAAFTEAHFFASILFTKVEVGTPRLMLPSCMESEK